MALRKLILADVNMHENGANPIQLGYSMEQGLEEHKKYSPNKIQCSGCGKDGPPLLFLGGCALCSFCTNAVYSFRGVFV